MKGQLRLAFFDLARTPPSPASLLSPVLRNLKNFYSLECVMKIYTRPQLNTFRKTLRNNMPQPERKLWFYIRRKQLGVKFRRQHSIGKYIVDFFCCELKLAIELDGNSHFSEQAQAYDHQRTRDLNKLEIKVLRFTNNEVNQNLEEVLVKIKNSIPR